MSVLDGFAAAREIQRLLPGVPILFSTMKSGEQFLSEAKKAGVQGFVRKDRASAALISAVNVFLYNGNFFP